jgi:fibrillarin-like rRNA methylase
MQFLYILTKAEWWNGGMDMENNALINSWTELTGTSLEDLVTVANAVSQVYPMIILANLTQNTYSTLRNENFLYNDVADNGVYEDLIDNNAENIHPNYQHLFQKCFSREHLIRSFTQGKTDVYAELYQKDRQGQYRWVSTHVIKIENESGDICHICLNRVLDGVVEERHGERK